MNDFRWNFIMTDDLDAFMEGFSKMCKVLNVNMWDYILGNPVSSGKF
jgi:hypothetical protein